MRIFFLTFLILSSWPALRSQSLSGRWTGILTQERKEITFSYLLDIEQDGNNITGVSYSATSDNSASAHFSLAGIWDGDQLVLQEIRQTEPASPQWCLKYMTLRLQSAGSRQRLAGDWQASGCTPGRVLLERENPEAVDTLERELPFAMAGTWTGQLSQSDRDYGFFFELTLAEAPQGTSHIVSEGNGGQADHALRWSFEEDSGTLVFKESAVMKKTDPRWPWCIKQGTLQLRREGMRYLLEGPWSGYIEGHDPNDSKAHCAPGMLYLEKPVLTEQVIRRTQQHGQAYQAKEGRAIKVERTLEVRSRNLRLRVWDNGTVDGDVVTLFLNGRRILHNYRVNKRKWAIPVTLEEANNFLILHAEDLGDIIPNTVGVSIDDGFKEQIIILSSNLAESGAVLIREIKVE
jgi:hypothetical protein